MVLFALRQRQLGGQGEGLGDAPPLPWTPTCCVLRVACCVLRVACCVLRVACCVLRVACCVLRVACCVACCVLLTRLPAATKTFVNGTQQYAFIYSNASHSVAFIENDSADYVLAKLGSLQVNLSPSSILIFDLTSNTPVYDTWAVAPPTTTRAFQHVREAGRIVATNFALVVASGCAAVLPSWRRVGMRVCVRARPAVPPRLPVSCTCSRRPRRAFLWAHQHVLTAVWAVGASFLCRCTAPSRGRRGRSPCRSPRCRPSPRTRPLSSWS